MKPRSSSAESKSTNLQVVGRVSVLCLVLFAIYPYPGDPTLPAASKPALASPETAIETAAPIQLLPAYNPRNCTNLISGHCQDQDGGAWSYRKADATCAHKEGSVPMDGPAMRYMPVMFALADSVLDFGGGVGAYLTGFRDAGVKTLVTVEPHDLGECLFTGLQQDTTDWVNTPLWQLPTAKYDVVMTIEVLEHIPVQYNQHLIKALSQASRKWFVFSAAHPGQGGEGHVGPSMKWQEQWINEVTNWTSLTYDTNLTSEFHTKISRLLRKNSAIFRKG